MVSQLIGTMLSFGLAIYIFNDLSDTDESSVDTRDLVNQLLLIQTVPIVITFVLFALLIREKPDIPPSAVAEAPIESRNLLESAIELRKNTGFVLLTC